MDFLEAYDLGTLYFVGGLHRPWLNPLVLALTHFGDNLTLLLVVVTAALFFLLRRRRLTAAVLVVNLLAANLIEVGFKHLVRRPRPEVVWRLVDLPPLAPLGPGFPSGHALRSMVVYALLGLIVARSSPRRRVRPVALALGLLLPMAVGLTRPYLGVHYPTDVLAGWCAGLGCALLAAEATAWDEPPAPASEGR
jgi:undecaprenyl-diphosphatase